MLDRKKPSTSRCLKDYPPTSSSSFRMNPRWGFKVAPEPRARLGLYSKFFVILVTFFSLVTLLTFWADNNKYERRGTLSVSSFQPPGKECAQSPPAPRVHKFRIDKYFVSSEGDV